MFGDQVISGFLFAVEGNVQTFYHELCVEGKLKECATCRSRIDKDDPPSQHWLQRGEHQAPHLTKQQQSVLDIIESRKIETFFICDESAKGDLAPFLHETCERAVPELLRMMFYNGTQRIEFSLAIYVNIYDRVYIFQSGSLIVENHYDIEVSVNVIYEMLTQRIEGFVICELESVVEQCSITRVRIQVKQLEEENEMGLVSTMLLPLQLRAESIDAYTTSDPDMSELHAAYVKHRRESDGYFPANMRANLFGMHQCQTTKELYVAPYHISETLDQRPNKNYLILNDINGEFQRLQELRSPPMSNTVTDPSDFVECCCCRQQFKCRSRLHIHQELRCGRDFVMDTMDQDIVEIHEHCLPISRSSHQYASYGVTRPKTIVKTEQYVPIECDWRSKSSVQVQQGSCVVISNTHYPLSKYYF